MVSIEVEEVVAVAVDNMVVVVVVMMSMLVAVALVDTRSTMCRSSPEVRQRD